MTVIPTSHNCPLPLALRTHHTAPRSTTASSSFVAFAVSRDLIPLVCYKDGPSSSSDRRTEAEMIEKTRVQWQKHRLSLFLVCLVCPATNGSLVLMPNGRLSLVTVGCEDRRGPTTAKVFFCLSFRLERKPSFFAVAGGCLNAWRVRARDRGVYTTFRSELG